MFSLKTATFGGLLAAGCFLAGAAFAAENGQTNYPAGAPGPLTGAFPPIPGLFVVNQTSFTTADGLYDSHGKKLPVPFKLDAEVDTARFLASWGKLSWLGDANFYNQLVVPYGHIGVNAFGFKNDDTGFSNVTVSPYILRWSFGAHSITHGFDIATRWGKYNSVAPVNIGTGYMSYMPVLAYHYVEPKGLELGVSGRLSLNERNSATHYQSGNAAIVDFHASWKFADLKLGVVGGYTKQYADDYAGSINIGNRLTQLAVGPSLTYQLGPAILNANYQAGVYAENGPKTSTLWLNLAFPLYVDTPPGKGGPKMP